MKKTIFCTLLLCCAMAAAETLPAPVIVTRPAKNGAVLVVLDTPASGTSLHYTVDGSTPAESSTQYFAPVLLLSSVEFKAVAAAGGKTSAIAERRVGAAIAPGTLAWSDEFANATGAAAQPDEQTWTYDTGGPAAFGNHELEVYCGWSSATTPCSATLPDSYVGTDGCLHIVARKTADGRYTSARLTTQGLVSFRYGRIEARIQIPEAQGMWPAFWLLGNDIATVHWPAAGEQDVMEHVNAPVPDWIEGSVHGEGFTGTVGLGTKSFAAKRASWRGWHVFGMNWRQGSVAFYVDDPAHPYVTYTPQSLRGMDRAAWPFDAGRANFLLLNLAVGGDWPGAPNSATVFPAEMLVDWVRVYAVE